MSLIWSYILVALCATLTSSRVIDFLGNGDDLHGNLIPDMKEEKLLAPPSSDGLNIDSDGFPGNSNDQKTQAKDKEDLNCKELCLKGEGGESCLCHWPAFLNEIFASLQNENDNLKEFEIIPFSKEDIINLEGSPLCETMCNSGVRHPPCKC